MALEHKSHYVSEHGNAAAHKQRSRLEALWWAGTLIWAGLIFAADSVGVLPQIGESSAWSWVFLGAGLYGTLGNLYRLTSSDVPNPTAWDAIGSGGLLIIGLGGFVAVDVFWPIVLMVAGLAILASWLSERN